MFNKRAAIDLGTNSFRLLVADSNDSCLHTAQRSMYTVRLGEELNNQLISKAAFKRGLKAISTFKQTLTSFSPDLIEIIACGTAVFRQAKNSKDFLQQAGSILGSPIHVLSPDREAYLSRVGATIGLTNQTSGIITIDTGGGSTELTIATDSTPPFNNDNDQWASISIPTGAVTLTETYLGAMVRSEKKIFTLRKAVQKIVTAELGPWLISLTGKLGIDSQDLALIASGGTATALACLDLNLDTYNAEKIQGHTVSRQNMTNIEKRLTGLSPAQANTLPGLGNRRGEIIIAGLIIIESIADFFNCKHITVSDTGLLEGIFLAGK